MLEHSHHLFWLITLTFVSGELLKQALQKSGISITKACIYLGTTDAEGHVKEKCRAQLMRELDGIGHLSMRQVDQLPLSTHQWMHLIGVLFFGLPPEVEQSLEVKLAITIVKERQMLKMEIQPAAEEEKTA